MHRTRLTVGQALARFLPAQYSERDGAQHRLVEACFGIFGHGNLAGFAQGLLEAELFRPGALRYYQARNEQAMVHTACAFARMRNRLSTLACASSVGPGATNMVTGAATATVNRIPVLLLPSDVFATRVADPVLQQLEIPTARDISVNDAFRPVSRFFDRVLRPEQLPDALFGAMGVLTDPVSTGAAVVCLPEDVQAEAYDWPDEFFQPRIWHVPRPPADPASIARAVQAIRACRRPLLVAGGGVLYSEAAETLRRFVEATGIPVAETQAGKGALAYDHPQAVGAIGATGTTAANALAREADLVIGFGTRWSDFTTASRSAFAAGGVRFVSCNIAPSDASKHHGVNVVGDARAVLEQLNTALAGWSVEEAYRRRAAELAERWDRTVEEAYTTAHSPLPSQSEVIGVLNTLSGPRDVVVCAAGSMPGDLHKLWRTRDPKGYHVEYGYSCMGYEIAGGIGVKLAAPEREVYVLVGDGSYLMLSQELLTAVQEHIKLTVVLVQNYGFASIGSLSDSIGSERFGTALRYRNPTSGRLDGGLLPLDLAGNAAALGVKASRVKDIAGLREALIASRAESGPVLIEIETDPLLSAPDSESWWDVPVAEVAEHAPTARARERYEQARTRQRRYW